MDAETPLWAALPDPTPEGYTEVYQHWRDGTLVDRHPNALAHGLIAAEIVAVYENRAPRPPGRRRAGRT